MTTDERVIDDLAAARFTQKTERLLLAANQTDHLVMYVAALDFLDSLYVLTEVARRWTSPPSFFADARETEEGRAVLGLRYLRGPAAHEAVVGQDFTDAFSDIYYDHFGMWAWSRGIRKTAGRQDDLPAYEDYVAGRELFLVVQTAHRFLTNYAAQHGISIPVPSLHPREAEQSLDAKQ